MKTMKDLTQGNIYKTFILFAIPLVLAGVLSQGYNMIDTVVAGKFLGDNGLAAIGATSSFLTFSSSIFWGYATGSSIYIAALFGAKKYKDIKQAVYHNLSFIALSAFLFGLIVVLMRDIILQLLRVDTAIYADAKCYLCIYILGLPLIMLSNSFVYLTNAFGLSSYPFYMSLISALLNVSGNILALTVLHMGIAGIAIATLFSALVVDCCYIIKLRQCFTEMGILHTKVSFDWNVLKKISTYALPVSAQQLIMYISTLLISPIVNGIGSSASAAYTVVMQIYNLNASIYQNSSKTLSNYTAQCVGAGKSNKLKKGVSVAFLQGILFESIPLLVCTLFAGQICALFFPAGYSGDGLNYAVIFARFYLPFIVFNLTNNLFHAFYRGIAAMKLLVSLTLLGSVSRIVYTLIFANMMGMQGIYLGWILSWITEAVAAVISYLHWRK